MISTIPTLIKPYKQMTKSMKYLGENMDILYTDEACT